MQLKKKTVIEKLQIFHDKHPLASAAIFGIGNSLFIKKKKVQ